MYELGTKFETIDLAKALANETGVFEAISPGGETFKVECRLGASIASLTPNRTHGNWQVVKLAELPTGQQSARAAGAGH
ncbi:MAG: hypothetical protein DMG37_05740 [Acidobacteria bacterium]|nr:MAG: hypothetical protein DMG37_05740 [Acidobacteriota bacterium]